MKKISLSLSASFLLFALLLAPSSSNAGGEAHPLIKRAINALQSAKTDLQNAAHDYCGHRVEALEATNAALNQLNLALECASRKGSSSGVDVQGDPESTASAGERHPNINRAISALGAAENDLQNAAHDYCGHRVQALDATRSALNQLRLAIECDSK
jgi:hypothetical protein